VAIFGSGRRGSPVNTAATDLAQFLTTVDKSADVIVERNGIPPNLDSVATERALAAKIAEAKGVDVAVAQRELDDYTRGADFFLGLRELERLRTPELLAFNAQQTEDGIPLGVAAALGHLSSGDSTPLFVTVADPTIDLSHQIDTASRALPPAQAEEADSISMIARGLEDAARTTFSRAFTSATAALPLRAPVVIQAPTEALPNLAAALSESGIRPDLLVQVGGGGETLRNIPTRVVSRDHPFARALPGSPEGVRILQIVERLDREREEAQHIRGQIPVLVQNFSDFHDRYDLDVDSDGGGLGPDFVNLMEALAHPDGLWVDDKPLNPLMLADQKGRFSRNRGLTSEFSTSPYSLITLGPVAQADNVQLIIANNRNVSFDATMRGLASAYRNDIDRGEQAVAVLRGSAPLVTETVQAAYNRLQAFNPSVTLHLRGDVPEAIPGATSRDLAAITTRKAGQFARGAADRLKDAVGRRMGPPKTGR
jgi:hypothetical protein